METQLQTQISRSLSLPAMFHISSLFSAVTSTALNTSASLLAQWEKKEPAAAMW